MDEYEQYLVIANQAIFWEFPHTWDKARKSVTIQHVPEGIADSIREHIETILRNNKADCVTIYNATTRDLEVQYGQ